MCGLGNLIEEMSVKSAIGDGSMGSRTVNDEASKVRSKLVVSFLPNDVGLPEECGKRRGSHRPGRQGNAPRLPVGRGLGKIVVVDEPRQEVGDIRRLGVQELLSALVKVVEILLREFCTAPVVASVGNDNANVAGRSQSRQFCKRPLKGR